MADMCPECGATFASAAELVTHQREQHADATRSAQESLEMNPASTTPGYECALCGARFRTPQELARHNLGPHANAGTARQSTPVPLG